jgi:prevent-host-death family protein
LFFIEPAIQRKSGRGDAEREAPRATNITGMTRSPPSENGPVRCGSEMCPRNKWFRPGTLFPLKGTHGIYVYTSGNRMTHQHGGRIMEVNVKEARDNIGKLLDRTEKGEEILISRRGKKVARLVPVDASKKRLPDLGAFRASIAVRGAALSQTVIDSRNMERY